MKSGNVKKWFSWLEWVTLSAVLFVAGVKSNSIVIALSMICLGFFSLFMLVVYTSTILFNPISKLLKFVKIPQAFVSFFLAIISYGVPIFVFYVLLIAVLTIANSMK